jgi:hypothetical protein
MLVGTRSRDALAAPACRKGGAAACADGEHGVPDPLDVNSHGTRGQVYIRVSRHKTPLPVGSLPPLRDQRLAVTISPSHHVTPLMPT